MTKRLLLATVLLGAAACEHGVDLEGTVTVPAQVQDYFMANAPGQLLVVATVPGVNALRNSQVIFCAPSGDDIGFVIRDFAFGCAPAGTAQVSAYAVRRSSKQIDCLFRTIHEEQIPSTFDPADIVAMGSVDAPVLGGGGRCSDGRIEFTMTVALPPMSGDQL